MALAAAQPGSISISNCLRRIASRTAEQQAAVSRQTVIVEHETAIVNGQILRVDRACHILSQRGGGDNATGRGKDQSTELFLLQLVIHIAGEEHLLGIDAALRRHHVL